MIGCELQNSSSCFRRLEWRMHTCCNSPGADRCQNAWVICSFISRQVLTAAPLQRGGCIVCWHPHQMTEIPAGFLGHTFLAWRSENDFKVFLEYLIYTRQQKWRKRDSLLNTSLKSVTKTVLSFVIFPETVFPERSCYHRKENLHFMFLKSWLTWSLAMKLPNIYWIRCVTLA